MKLPNRLLIKGRTFQVCYRWRLHDENKEPCESYTDFKESTVWLDRGMTADEKFQALLKEIIRIFMDDLNLFETGGIRDRFVAETLCKCLAINLPQLFSIKFR